MATITLKIDSEALERLEKLLKEHPDIKIENLGYGNGTDFAKFGEAETQFESSETIQVSLIEYHKLIEEIKFLREILSARDQVQRGEVIDHDTLFNELRLSYSIK
jgi:hypothetical protein